VRHVDAVLGERVLNTSNNYDIQKKNLTIEGKYLTLKSELKKKLIDGR
jgi:hypothetical protein